MTEQTDGRLGEAELARLTRIVEITLDAVRNHEDRDVRFGEGDHQAFSPDWASLMLRELFSHHRAVFGECLQGAFAEVRKARPGPKARP